MRRLSSSCWKRARTDDRTVARVFDIAKAEGKTMRTTLRVILLAVVSAIAFSGAVLTESAAADGTPVQFEARVSWVAAETMVVATDDGVSVSIDLSQVAQDEYQRLASGARVIVTGALGGNRVRATSIESLEP
jgi:hypothetical protein